LLRAGLQALDSHLAVLLQDKLATDAPARSKSQQALRACLALRIMLLETRQQLNLLCSNFAAARADAFDSMRVLSQFPQLLAGLGPVVHMQAGLYAQAVGSFAAAGQHFMAAAEEGQAQGAPLLAADARQLAAMCYVAANTADSGAVGAWWHWQGTRFTSVSACDTREQNWQGTPLIYSQQQVVAVHGPACLPAATHVAACGQSACLSAGGSCSICKAEVTYVLCCAASCLPCYIPFTSKVKLAREVLGPISTEGDPSLGYGSRCLYHTAAGLMQLSGPNVGSDERADAKQHFSRALKMAHKHLHNHQVVSQLLMMMAPLQVGTARARCCLGMLDALRAGSMALGKLFIVLGLLVGMSGLANGMPSRTKPSQHGRLCCRDSVVSIQVATRVFVAPCRGVSLRGSEVPFTVGHAVLMCCCCRLLLLTCQVPSR
jgi:hypothetical protein